MLRRLVLIAGLGGCWTSASSDPSSPPPSSLKAGSGRGRDPACPAQFASAQGACTGGATCSYPEGSCVCTTPPWCGGAAPPRDYERPLWQCTPHVRADGCPGEQPADGSPCQVAGTSCDYTCSCVLIAECTGGTWRTKHGPCKP